MKKRSAYDRPTTMKGDIKFYDTKKTKKATPIATITDAYSAYAIYPQSKPLIDQSTLVKVEGRITIHSKPESKTEGFVFVLPEVHPAVSGFEMMLRWLFPVYDTFGLYGRPNRLIADTLDTRGLMFAMPKERRYGYLDIQDVAALVCAEGSQSWSEQEWRKRMKDVTSKRLSNMTSRTTSRQGSRKGARTSLPAGTNLRYEDGDSIRSNHSTLHKHNQSTDNVFVTPQKTRTAPPGGSLTSSNYHARSVSDTLAFSNSPRKRKEQYVPSRLSMDREQELDEKPPPAPAHGMATRRGRPGDLELPKPRMSLDNNEIQQPIVREPEEVGSDLRPQPPPTPVAAPPAFLHSPGERPPMRPNASPELRRANSRMSISTLSQLVDASKSSAMPADAVAAAGAAAAWMNNKGLRNQDQGSKGVNETLDRGESPADQRFPRKGLVAGVKNGETASTDSLSVQPSPPSGQRPDHLIRSSTDKSVTRKPVPTSQTPIPTPPTTRDGQAVEGFSRTEIVDNPFSSRDRLADNTESNRDDESTHDTDTSVDYSSARESSESKRADVNVPKQRTGVLKTVGNPNHIDPPTFQTDGLNVHQATTQNYLTNSNRNSSGTLGAPNPSAGWDQSRTPSDSLTPRDEKRLSSYIGRVSPNSDPNSRSHSRSPKPGDRSVPWQPGAAAVGSGRKSPGPRITPEEFVQQRATGNRVITPTYAPQKNRSSGNLPLERPVSGDWSKRKDVGSRPSSGEASAMLAHQQDYSSHLSAREQEHVARMTNSPLVNVNDKRNQPSQPSAGLVGAIQAREQEKKQVREGISGQMVQHAIAQRQQQYQLYRERLAQQQMAQQQAQAQPFSQNQAYQPQVASGFYGNQQPQSQSNPSTPGGWGMQPSPQQQWPNAQIQSYWGNVQPQQQYPQQMGQQTKPEWQAYMRHNQGQQ
jgi:CCR4-NOT transcriptional complex subunit CAF120